MQDEIEAKFIQCNHDSVRQLLTRIGAECHSPMRLMTRAILDYPDGRLAKIHAYIRVRDEGDKISVTYKQDAEKTFGSAKEIETTVGSLDTMVQMFEALGLVVQSRQESKRETWKIDDVEVVLDEWPWLDPYIEIEGPTKEHVMDVAKKLGFTWRDAVFGSVTAVYKLQYPDIEREGKISTIENVAFNLPAPDWFHVKGQE